MIKIFLDTCSLDEIRKWKDRVDGFTTNPSLAHKAGVTDYEKFCKEVLKEVPDKPVSFEVFADEFDEMEGQAKIIASWGKNVYVKIPRKFRTAELYLKNLIKDKEIKNKVRKINLI